MHFLDKRNWYNLAKPIGLAMFLLLAPSLWARVLNVVPTSEHSALTITSSKVFGYQVLPSKPMRLDVVGPGTLSITIRLNQKSKRSVYSGQIEIRRDKRKIKVQSLRLPRSKSGGYQEEPSWMFSAVKSFKLEVPRGVHNYLFNYKGNKGTSAWLQVSYETEADQGLVSGEEDALALVPLVAADSETKSSVAQQSDEDSLPLVALTPSSEKTTAGSASSGSESIEHNLAGSLSGASTSGDGLNNTHGNTKVGAAGNLPTPSENATELKASQESRAPGRDSHLVSLGLKAGQISPFPNKLFGTSYIGSLDVRYILPGLKEHLTLGVEVGYYPGEAEISQSATQHIKVQFMVVPISLQLYYRIPLGTVLEPFVGAGASLFVFSGESEFINDQGESAPIGSGTSVVYGGQVMVGVEAELGPGFLLAEARLGKSFGDTDVFHNHSNVSGFVALLGYRFVL